MGNNVILTLIVSFLLAGFGTAQNLDIKLVEVAGEHKVDVHIEGKHFTSYQFGPDFDMKPVFYPILSPDGVVVNREIPLGDEKPNQQQDHPHHQSVFLGYGNVDGFDFWSHRNQERVVHRTLLERDRNSLSFLADWVDPSGKILLHEIRKVAFGGTSDCFWMDHVINLTSLETRSFADTKEGMFAIRVAESLREDRGSGRYLNAYGWETENEIWGKRAPWVALRGEVEGQPVTIAIFDHPSTENHPSYWHARAYGLFSVNPFGRKDFVKNSSPINKVLQANQNIHFRYRLLVYQGKVSKKRLDQDYWEYVQ